MQNPSYWHHLTSWWPRRADSDTLFVCYEDLVKDREAQIRRVAEFLLLPNTAPAGCNTRGTFCTAHQDCCARECRFMATGCIDKECTAVRGHGLCQSSINLISST